MASEPTDGETVSARLPEDLETWLDERADELGLDRGDLFRRLLSAYQVAAGAEDASFGPSGELEELETRLERTERTHSEDIEDVRKRVLHVKNLAESKADTGHDHEAFDRLDALDEQVSALGARMESLSETVEQLTEDDADPDTEYEELDQKLKKVARAMVQLRRDVEALEEARQSEVEERSVEAHPADEANAAEMAAQTETENDSHISPSVDADASDRLLELKRLAAREGYTKATCGACGERAHVALLPEPACPACHAPVYDIMETGGLRKKPTFVGQGGVSDE